MAEPVPASHKIDRLSSQSLDSRIDEARLGRKKEDIIPTRTTMEIKWGIYVSVWEILFNLEFLMSFRIRARMIGTGKPAIREYRLKYTVLRT